MRSVLGFFSGMITGLGRTAGRVRHQARPRGARSTGRSASAGGGSGPPLGHLAVLLLAAACGAAALTAASHGQKIRGLEGPATGPAATPASPDDLAEVLATDPGVVPHDWHYIVMHHSGTAGGSAQSFDQSHRERGWRCLGYHFVIGNGNGQGDGAIVAGPRWYSQEGGAHANSNEYNQHGIGICLVGNMEELPPTPAQWAAARALVTQLRRAYNIPPENVVGHNQVREGGSTACPGKLMPLSELREDVP
ncbi:MAG: peptidoglycan recognition family protein [Planctomycetota bacterium]